MNNSSLNNPSNGFITKWEDAGEVLPNGTVLPKDGFVYVVAIQSYTYVNGFLVGIMTTSGGSGWTSPNANCCFFARKGDVVTGTSFYFKPIN